MAGHKKRREEAKANLSARILDAAQTIAKERGEPWSAEYEPASRELQPTADDRRAYIKRAMVTGPWVHADRHKFLAAAWGVSPATVGWYAAEASRGLKLTGDSEYWRARQAATVDRVIKGAARERNIVTGMRDLKGFCDVVRLGAELAGVQLATTTKVELTGKDGGPVLTADAAKIAQDELLSRLARVAASGAAGSGGPEPIGK